MGRAGSGGGGGHSHSSGGHSSGSRSSGGHSMSSSRAGSSRSSSRGGYSSNRMSPPALHSYPPPRSRYMYGGGMRGPVVVHTRTNRWDAIILVIMLAFIIGIIAISGVANSGVKSSYAREKLDLGIAFDNDCVYDELGWVENTTKLEKNLKYFYDKTGLQPIIYLKEYDSSLSNENMKIAWAENWYDRNIDNEGTFLFVYFAEEDTDNDVGFMSYVTGIQASAMMDSEAIEIFWSVLDSEWYSDATTVDMFTNVYKTTADRITTKSKTLGDVMFPIVVVICIGVSAIIIVKVIDKKRKAEKEKAEETERILNTPLDKL